MQESMIGQNIVITESSKNLRALGRNALAGKWKTAIITVLIFTVCVKLPTLVFDSLFGVNMSNVLTNDGYTYGMDANLYAQLYNTMPSMSILSLIYILLVTGPLTLGLTMFFLAMFRQHRTEPVDLFLGFEQFKKSLGLLLFQSLFIYLWMLLFIIPGIIAAIRYSQAFFILADDPSKGIRQCMDESKAMMRGNKAKYFWLMLSFIGWMILSGLPAGIIENIGSIISSNDFVVALFAFIGSLFIVPVTAYLTSTQAGFYEILAGHLIKETEPSPALEGVYAIGYDEESEEEDSAEEEVTAEAPAEEPTEVAPEEAPKEASADEPAAEETATAEDTTTEETATEDTTTEEAKEEKDEENGEV